MVDRRVVWVGAAALAAGLSVAGPQVGPAGADAGDSAAGVSAGSSSRQGAAVRAGRSATRVSPATAVRARAADQRAANRARPPVSSAPSGAVLPAANPDKTDILNFYFNFNYYSKGLGEGGIPYSWRRWPGNRSFISVRTADKAAPELLLKSLQASLGRAFNSVRDLSNTVLPAPLAEIVKGGLFLVRRAVLPTGKDVGLFGDAACVSAGDCSGKDLTGVQLDGQDLTGITWTGATLKQANLRGADLSNADFGPASLPWTLDVVGVTVTDSPGISGGGVGNYLIMRRAGTTFAIVDSRDAIGGGARTVAGRTASQAVNTPDCEIPGSCVGADFEGADLEGADLDDANMVGSDFDDANLSTAQMLGTVLSGSTLVGANLTFANASDAYLNNANLTNANLTDAILGGANLSSATLKNATLVGTGLLDALLADANLTNANLTKADLSGAFLAGANLRGVTWSDTTCPDGSVTWTGCSA